MLKSRSFLFLPPTNRKLFMRRLAAESDTGLKASECGGRATADTVALGLVGEARSSFGFNFLGGARKQPPLFPSFSPGSHFLLQGNSFRVSVFKPLCDASLCKRRLLGCLSLGCLYPANLPCPHRVKANNGCASPFQRSDFKEGRTKGEPKHRSQTSGGRELLQCLGRGSL